MQNWVVWNQRFKKKKMKNIKNKKYIFFWDDIKVKNYLVFCTIKKYIFFGIIQKC